MKPKRIFTRNVFGKPVELGGAGGGVEKVDTLPETGEEGKIYYNTTNKQYYRYHEGSGFSTMGLEDPIPTPFDAIFNISLQNIREHSIKYENGQIVQKTHIDVNKTQIGDILQLNINKFSTNPPNGYGQERLKAFMNLCYDCVEESESDLSIFNRYDGCIYTLGFYEYEGAPYAYIKNIQLYDGQVYTIEGITYRFVKVPYAMNGVDSLIGGQLPEENIGYVWTPKIINVEYHRQTVQPTRIEFDDDDDRDIVQLYLGPVHSNVITKSDAIIFGDFNSANHNLIFNLNYFKYEAVYRLIPITGRFIVSTAIPTIMFPTRWLRFADPDNDIQLETNCQYEYNIYDGVITLTPCYKTDNYMEDTVIDGGNGTEAVVRIGYLDVASSEIKSMDFESDELVATKRMYEEQFGTLDLNKPLVGVAVSPYGHIYGFLYDNYNVTDVNSLTIKIQVSNDDGIMLPAQTFIPPIGFEGEFPTFILYPQELFGDKVRKVTGEFDLTHHKLLITIDTKGEPTIHVELNNDAQLINNDYFFVDPTSSQGGGSQGGDGR